MERKQSELTVITKAKDLCSYVMTVTQKSPKHFHYIFVSKLQNLALGVIENLFRANDVYPEGGIARDTPWSKVSDDFECPLCGVEKNNVEEVQRPGSTSKELMHPLSAP